MREQPESFCFPERVVVAYDRVAVELLAAEACNAGARPALADLQLRVGAGAGERLALHAQCEGDGIAMLSL